MEAFMVYQNIGLLSGEGSGPVSPEVGCWEWGHVGMWSGGKGTVDLWKDLESLIRWLCAHYITLGKLLQLSELEFPNLSIGENSLPPLTSAVGRIKWAIPSETPAY